MYCLTIPLSRFLNYSLSAVKTTSLSFYNSMNRSFPQIIWEHTNHPGCDFQVGVRSRKHTCESGSQYLPGLRNHVGSWRMDGSEKHSQVVSKECTCTGRVSCQRGAPCGTRALVRTGWFQVHLPMIPWLLLHLPANRGGLLSSHRGEKKQEDTAIRMTLHRTPYFGFGEDSLSQIYKSSSSLSAFLPP